MSCHFNLVKQSHRALVPYHVAAWDKAASPHFPDLALSVVPMSGQISLSLETESPTNNLVLPDGKNTTIINSIPYNLLILKNSCLRQLPHSSYGRATPGHESGVHIIDKYE